MSSITSPFERLERTATSIARHPDYPGKQGVVADCLEDVEGRWREGDLLLEQRFRLYSILLKTTRTRPRPPLPRAV